MSIHSDPHLEAKVAIAPSVKAFPAGNDRVGRFIPSIIASFANLFRSQSSVFDGTLSTAHFSEADESLAQDHDQEEQMLLSLSRLADRVIEGRPQHAERVAALSFRLALAGGMNEQDALLLRRAARLLDIGFLAVPQTVLTKQGPLTVGERAAIDLHAQAGAAILSRFKSPVARIAQRIAAHHHEWWNGAGYPNGLIDDSIPLAARIVAIADVFDALICQRAGRDALTIDEALDRIRDGAGVQFDPRLVDLFIGLVQQEKAISGQYALGPDA